MNYGILYLIPVPLGERVLSYSLPSRVQEHAAKIEYFIVENAKTARAFLKTISSLHSLSTIKMEILNKHTPTVKIKSFLAPLLVGKDVGLISEAGCPAIADPGALLIRLAHEHAIPVRPLVGPSSILLALMASGTTGQKFTFHGYLPIANKNLVKTIHILEHQSLQQRSAEIFIETPYRNNALLQTLCAICRANTLLTIACNLTMPNESITTQPIATWRKAQLDLHNQPCVFILYAGD